MVRALGDAPIHLRSLKGVALRLKAKQRRNRDGVHAVDEFKDSPHVSSAPEVPTVTFSRSKAPGIAKTFDDAVADGAPTQLTRVSSNEARANRREALRGHDRAPAGQSLDEYPFASSAQGGSGSTVRPVPKSEQNHQGGILSSFYQRHKIQDGDRFNVEFGP